MKAKLGEIALQSLDDRHLALVEREFRQDDTSVTYLNTGSVGRKPRSVLASIQEGISRLNINPTRFTYLEEDILEGVRESVSALLAVDKECLVLADSTTQALQLILQSYLRKAGDEVIITDREHGSTKTILRYLEDTRGVRVRKYHIEPGCSTEQMSLELLNLITRNTKLVVVSEIDCYSGWRPELTLLSESLKLLEIPLLVDGAHAPGNGPTNPSRYSMWVGAGHKWLGAPNCTAFAYVSKECIPQIEPVWIGDGYFEAREKEIYDLRRFEIKGNRDVVKWIGLKQAIELYQGLDQDHIVDYQTSLLLYLRSKLLETKRLNLRKPGFRSPEGEEQASMLTFYAPPELFTVTDLRAALWDNHKIWIQPDFLGSYPGSGGRVSFHYSTTLEDIDKFFDCLISYMR